MRLNRKIFYHSKSIEYLRIKIDENLNWKQHIHDNAFLLFTFRNYVNKLILRTIYFAIFDSHINYANLIWGQNLNDVN